MIVKRGQAALEFLMTYGWAFLVMIAVIAGIVALDPLGAAQTNINTCQTGGPLSCDGDQMILSASSNDLNLTLENTGRETITIDNLNITNQGGSGDISWNTGTLTLEPGEVSGVDFNKVNNVLAGEFTTGDQYTFDLEGDYYTTRAGSDFSRPLQGQVRIVASS
jgi:hypothetical protein